MNLRRTPWWVWLIAAFVLLRVLDLRVPFVPLLIAAVVLVNVLGRQGRRGRAGLPPPSRRPHGGHLGHGVPGPQDRPTAPGQQPAQWQQPGPADQPPPMPTIEVPPYPGAGAARPAPGLPGGGPPATGPTWTSPDPVVSLGQLHLSRAGRDLQHAAADGTATELTRVLDEIQDLVTRMQGMLSAASGAAASGRDAFGQGLAALDRQVREARGENPPGPRVARVAQTCLRMGQTGRHE